MAGLLTLVNMRADVLDMLESNSKVSDTFLNRVINQAYNHITRPTVFDHPELQLIQDIPLVAATADYLLDTRLIAIMHDDGVLLIRTDGQRTRLTRSNYSRHQEDANLFTGSTGTPSRYARRGRRIYLNAFPSTDLVGATLRVPYRGRPLPLAADGALTEIDDIFDQVITHLAAGFGWARLGQPQRSDFFRDFAITMANDYGATLDLDATDPSDGFEIEEGNTVGGYVETA